MSQFIEMFGDPMTNDKQWPKFSCLNEVTQIVLGSTPKSNNPSYWDGDIRWITPAEMTDSSYFIYDTERHITEEGRKAANLTMLPEGAVLFSTRAPIGKVGIVGKEMCCNQGFKNFICSEKINNIFLYYTLKFKKEYLCSLGTGTTFKELSKRTVESLRIAVPPIELQKQFEVIYHQADKSEFGDSKSQFIEMFGNSETNAKNYPIKKIGDFADCFAGATPSTKISAYWDNGKIPWMSSGEVHKGRVKDTDAKISQQGYDGCSTKMVPIHSVVIALAGQGKTRGTVAINDIELCTNQSLCAIVPNEEVNYEYLYHNLKGRYKELRSMSGDVDGRGGLNLKHIQSIRIVVPPMEEQLKFVSIAQQADKSEYELRSKIDAIDNDIKSFINENMKRIEYRYTLGKNTFIIMDGSICKVNPIFV